MTWNLFNKYIGRQFFPTSPTASNSTELQKTYKSTTEITLQSYQRSSTPSEIKSARNIDRVILCSVNPDKEFTSYTMTMAFSS